MPNYTKFFKDIMSKKRKFEKFKTVIMSEEYSAVLQKKLPQKTQDHGNFTILYDIGTFHFNKVLCDLAASINLMPYTIF